MTKKENYIREINKAFEESNIEFLLGCVTEDIKWDVIGERIIYGTEDFQYFLHKMENAGAMKIKINEIISKGNKSFVEGLVELNHEPGKKKTYAFCDVYVFDENESDKINELRTYITLLKKIKKL